MSSLTISKNSPFSSTVISNTFIDDYMKEANDAQIKVYLYLTRMINANQPVGITDIADKFNHTEREVMRALKYWEQTGLMSLQYDESKNLCGIVLQDLNKLQNTSIKSQTPSRHETAAAAISESVQSVPAPAILSKPSYSLDDMKLFKQQEESEQLLFIVEQYLAKPLTTTDVKSLMYICQCLHFNTDLVDYLVQYCVERGKREFHYIEKVAITWAEAGIQSVKEARKFANGYDSSADRIMKALGRTSAPTTRELDFIRKWTMEYSYHENIILEACNRSSLATDKHRFEYADGILTNWKNANVKQVSDIKKLEEEHKASPRTTSATNNKFNSFKQNTYDFSQLERDILSN